MIRTKSPEDLPPWTEDVWDRWFYSFMKEVSQPEDGEAPTPPSDPVAGGAS
ncbi:MAG TPA: hypothetical protein VHE12_09790 [bacterium]|nr:hypothetical protein [bacterium]